MALQAAADINLVRKDRLRQNRFHLLDPLLAITCNSTMTMVSRSQVLALSREQTSTDQAFAPSPG